MTASDWKSSLSHVSRPHETHSVGGKPQKFYALRVSTALKLKDTIKALSGVILTFFDQFASDKNSKDFTSIQRTIHSPLSTDTMRLADTEIVAQAVDRDVLKFRLESKQTAVNAVLDAMSVPANQEAMAQAIMCSMRDVFPDPAQWPPAQELFGTIDAPLVIEMLIGVVKGNKRVFGPLADKAGAALAQALLSLTAVHAAKSTNPQGENSTSTDGKDSPTPQSGSQDSPATDQTKSST